MEKSWYYLTGQVTQSELGRTSRAREVISKFLYLFRVKKGTSKRYLSIFITIAIPFK